MTVEENNLKPCFRKAVPADAPILSATRQKAWNATYRGIYPDKLIDEYDFAARTEFDKKRIEDPSQLVFLLMDGETCGGYFCLGTPAYGKYKDFDFCLNALYFLPPYQGCGFGRQAFRIAADECRQRGLSKFFCGCNAHNLKARAFYGHMGGHLGTARLGHSNRAEDQVYFEFYLEPMNQGEMP